jgi:hypothetical protein
MTANFLSLIGILHKDFSAHNIMVNGETFIVADFDQSIICTDRGVIEKNRTGTPMYMSQRILSQNAKPVTHSVVNNYESIFWVQFKLVLELLNTPDSKSMLAEWRGVATTTASFPNPFQVLIIT